MTTNSPPSRSLPWQIPNVINLGYYTYTLFDDTGFIRVFMEYFWGVSNALLALNSSCNAAIYLWRDQHFRDVLW